MKKSAEIISLIILLIFSLESTVWFWSSQLLSFLINSSLYSLEISIISEVESLDFEIKNAIVRLDKSYIN